MAERIQLRRTKGWRLPEGAVFVARPSRWGNPFRVYHGHSTVGPSWNLAMESWDHVPSWRCTAAYVTSSAPLGPEAAVDLFRTLIQVRRRDEHERLSDWLAPLVGRELACWCPVDQPCHADVLLEFAHDLEASRG